MYHDRKIIHHDQMASSQRCRDGLTYASHLQHINISKDKTHLIISIDTEKVFNKIPCHFMIKALMKVGIEII
jgi:hypothetical protein